MTDMKKTIITPLLLTLITLAPWLQACTSQSQPAQAVNSPTPSSDRLDITAVVLDELLKDKSFTVVLKSKVQLTDQQLASLKQISNDEMARLGSVNAENRKSEAEASSVRVAKS